MQQSAANCQATTLTQTIADLKLLVANNGVLTLWRGLGPTLWRDVPFSAMYWYGYEMINAKVESPFLAGIASGMV